MASSIGGIMAGEHMLQPKVARACKDYHYDHLDQTEERPAR